MILQVFAVRDRATDAFFNPMFLISAGQAIRSFADEINNKNNDSNNMLSKHPDDFDLYILGSYNSDTGLFDTGVPKQIAIGKDLVISANGS